MNTFWGALFLLSKFIYIAIKDYIQLDDCKLIIRWFIRFIRWFIIRLFILVSFQGLGWFFYDYQWYFFSLSLFFFFFLEFTFIMVSGPFFRDFFFMFFPKIICLHKDNIWKNNSTNPTSFHFKKISENKAQKGISSHEKRHLSKIHS